MPIFPFSWASVSDPSNYLVTLGERALFPGWDYLARFLPNLTYLTNPKAADHVNFDGRIHFEHVTSHLNGSFGTSLVFIMVGCGALSVALFARKGGHRKTEQISRRESTILTSDAVSTTSIGSSLNKKGGKISSKSQHLKRNGNADIDPGLLKKHSSMVSYTTPIATYPGIRTFFCPHPHIDKLPSKPTPLPLLVFVHGLGGSLAQFHPLLTTLVNVAPCFGIDFPGCGLSSFSPKSWDAYSIEALANLLVTAIEEFRDKERGQKVILIGHSLGCSISALVASPNNTVTSELKKHVVGLIAICPPAGPPSQANVAKFRKFLYIPGPIFDLWRRWDRRGSPNSPSVLRMVGEGADKETKKLQARFNEQSRTPVWRRMSWGTLPSYDETGEAIGGIPGQAVWSGIDVPILLVAGELDPVTMASEVTKILQYFGGGSQGDSEPLDLASVEMKVSSSDRLVREESLGSESESSDNVPLVNGDVLEKSSQVSGSPKRIVRAFVFPAPASHALPYDRNTYRALSGLMQDFLPKHVDHRLSLGWQLQLLTTSGKWDVKNVVKWQAVEPVSKPIADTFVAMKTLREVDEEHTPIKFAEKWRGKIHSVIDISHESPVYDPAQLDKGGIQYHKLPTVSKVPPTEDEVRDFIALVDRLEEEVSATMSAKEEQGEKSPVRPNIGVHCHYGFNRTGFFITSYLIERKGFSVQAALDEFEKRRNPGIRHEHFIDTLFVRYCVGLHKASSV